MARYCRYCGGVVDENTGVCTKCHKQVVVQQPIKPSMQGQTIVNLSKKELKKLEKQRQKQIDEQRRQNEKDARPIGKKISSYFLQMFGLIFVLSILALGIIGTLQYYGIINIPALGNVMDKLNIVRNVEKEDEIVEDDIVDENDEVETHNDISQDNGGVSFEENDEYPNFEGMEMVDADDYFEKNSTIINKEEANKSKQAQSESDVYIFLSDRGFGEYEITYEYTIDGKYVWETNIDSASSIKHPYYDTSYYVENKLFWYISVINGRIVATASVFDQNNNSTSTLVVSEKESIISYDGATNTFYETIPNNTSIIVVDILNSDTLVKITSEVIDDGE